MKTALIVIDMQNDYLYEKRKDIFIIIVQLVIII